MNVSQLLRSLALNAEKLPHAPADANVFKIILQFVFAAAGSIALLIIVIAAFQFTISRGDPQATNKARNTIIYAVVGLVITMGAFSIVTFVVGRL